MKRSASVIIRSTAMYRPLQFFCTIGLILFALGLAVGIRFLVYFFMGTGGGHVQSLILASVLLMIGFQTITLGLLGTPLPQTGSFWKMCSTMFERWTMTEIRRHRHRMIPHRKNRRSK